MSRPRPGGGGSRARPRGPCIPACTEAYTPSRRLLLRTVRILLECILVIQSRRSFEKSSRGRISGVAKKASEIKDRTKNPNTKARVHESPVEENRCQYRSSRLYLCCFRIWMIFLKTLFSIITKFCSRPPTTINRRRLLLLLIWLKFIFHP